MVLPQSDERADDRLNGLMSLYGILAQPAAQMAVLLAAAAYAAKNAAKCRAAFSAAGAASHPAERDGTGGDGGVAVHCSLRAPLMAHWVGLQVFVVRVCGRGLR